MIPCRTLIPFLLALTLTGCTATANRLPSASSQVRSQVLDAPPSPCGERYYLLVFGAQTTPKIPRLTHSWATALRVIDRGPEAPPLVQEDTISWLPATCQVRPWRFWIERAKNLDLHSSLEVCLDKREYVSAWGPFEMRDGAYKQFLMQKAFLESGQIGYQAIDVVGEAAKLGTARNCVHALTDMDPLFDHQTSPIFQFGNAGSESVVRQLAQRGALVDPCRTHDWLIPVLGLDRYPLIRRSFKW